MAQAINIPKLPAQIVQPNGAATPWFYRFLLLLWQRTGGLQGEAEGYSNTNGDVTPLASLEFASGMMMPFVGSVAPTGWLLAQGQAVNRTLYADLFAAIGTTYGPGDGHLTFNLPNFVQNLVWNNALTLLPILSAVPWIIKT